MRALPLVALASALIVCGAARADVVIHMQGKDLTSDPPGVVKHHLTLGSDRLRAEGSGASGDAFTVIYRGDRRLIWHLDPTKKTYAEIDEASMAAMGQKLDGALQQMQEELSKLPPEQRKFVEQTMKGMVASSAGAPPKPVIEVRDSGKGETIAGRACTRHDVVVDGKTRSEVWVASWKDAGVSKESFAVFQDLGAFYQKLLESMPALRQAAGQTGMYEGADKIDGFPMRVRTLNDAGQAVYEMVFESVETKKADASAYEIPAGFTKQEMHEH